LLHCERGGGILIIEKATGLKIDKGGSIMVYIKESGKPIDEVCNNIQQAAAKNQFGVLGVIDMKEKMAAKGVRFGPQCRIIELCNPVQAREVLEANMTISTALPCRISVYQEQGKVKVVTLRPTVVLSLFDNPELDPVARDVEDAIVRIIDEACK
jgi:uncharacterized protein (DUF302 family)